MLLSCDNMLMKMRLWCMRVTLLEQFRTTHDESSGCFREYERWSDLYCHNMCRHFLSSCVL